MKNKLSILSLDNASAEKDSLTPNCSMTNSSKPSNVSFEHPFLSKGMLLGLCLRGHARLRINFKEYTLSPNSVFTILPNQIFESLEKSDDHYVECLFFSVDFANTLPLPKDFDILNNMKHMPCLAISEEYMQELIELRTFISKVCDSKRHTYNENVAKSLIASFIALIATLYSEAGANTELKTNSRGEVIVDEFSRLLMEHHKTERKASFYSDKLCISTQYLSRTLKKYTSRSVNAWITEAVILEAKALLKSSDASIQEISEELNFPNPSFFIRYFKQYTGATPLKYRVSD